MHEKIPAGQNVRNLPPQFALGADRLERERQEVDKKAAQEAGCGGSG
jgi:hypothetical protein